MGELVGELSLQERAASQRLQSGIRVFRLFFFGGRLLAELFRLDFLAFSWKTLFEVAKSWLVSTNARFLESSIIKMCEQEHQRASIHFWH